MVGFVMKHQARKLLEFCAKEISKVTMLVTYCMNLQKKQTLFNDFLISLNVLCYEGQ